MRRIFRLALLAAMGVLALVFAASAFASYSPRLTVLETSYRPTAQPAVGLLVKQGRTDDPTAKITIYSALGSTVTLTQAPGTTIGAVAAHVIALDLTGPNGKPIPLTGTVTVDSPAKYITNPCAPGLHQAVWLLNAGVAGQTLSIPVYVDRTAGAEQAIASAKIQVCFGPPDVPQGTPGRAPLGAKLVDAVFVVGGVFTNPASLGMYPWRSLWTPYTPGTGRPNAVGTVEEDGVVPIPYSLTLHKLKARRGFRLGGTLSMAGRALARARVAIYKVGTNVDTLFGTTRTNKKGRFVFARRHLKRTSVFYAERGPVATSCATPSLGVPCQSAVISPIDSRNVKVRRTRR